MPRGKKSASTPVRTDPNAGRRFWLPSDAKWGGYVDLKLDEDQRGSFDEWYQHPKSDFWPLLPELLADGLALGVKYDAENECFIASLSGKGISNSNERYALTARSSDPIEAVALCVYKHAVLMGGTWDNWMPKSGRLRQWG